VYIKDMKNNRALTN